MPGQKDGAPSFILRTAHPFFINDSGRLRAGWRLLLFAALVSASYFLWFRLLLPQVFQLRLRSFLNLLLYRGSFLIPTLVIVVFMVRWIDRRSWRSFGLTLNVTGLKVFLLGSLIGTLMISLFFVALYLSGDIRSVGLNLRFNPGIFGLYALAWLIRAALEEIIFRGYLLQTLVAGLRSKAVSVLLSSALFGIAHLLNPAETPHSVGASMFNGILFGLSYLWKQSLWTAIGLHFAHNFVNGHIFAGPLRRGIASEAQLLRAQWPSIGPTTPMSTTLMVAALASGLIYLAVIILMVYGLRRSQKAQTQSRTAN